MKIQMRTTWRGALATIAALLALLAGGVVTTAAAAGDPAADVAQCGASADETTCLAGVVSDTFALAASEDASSFAISGRDVVSACAASFEAPAAETCVASTAQVLVN